MPLFTKSAKSRLAVSRLTLVRPTYLRFVIPPSNPFGPASRSRLTTFTCRWFRPAPAYFCQNLLWFNARTTCFSECPMLLVRHSRNQTSNQSRHHRPFGCAPARHNKRYVQPESAETYYRASGRCLRLGTRPYPLWPGQCGHCHPQRGVCLRTINGPDRRVQNPSRSLGGADHQAKNLSISEGTRCEGGAS